MFSPLSAFAQAPPPPPNSIGSIFAQVQQVANTWVNPILSAAARLFYLLAVIDFCWSSVSFLREQDFAGLFLAMVRKFLVIAFFAMVVVNGNVWIPAIVNSFAQLGSNISGLPAALTPSDIMQSGLQQMTNLASQFQATSILTNFGGALLTLVVLVIVLISYIIITLHYIVAKLEAIIVMSAGYLFLGFAGSRWTMPYFERYIALAISAGTRLLLVYLMLAAFMAPGGLDQTWQQQIAAYQAGQPVSNLFPTLGGMLLFAFAAWMIPKLAGSIASGSLGLGAADLLSATSTAGAAGFAGAAVVTSVVTAGAGLVVGAGALAALSGSGGSAALAEGSSGAIAGGEAALSGGSAAMEGGAGIPASVPPPTRSSSFASFADSAPPSSGNRSDDSSLSSASSGQWASPPSAGKGGAGRGISQIVSYDGDNANLESDSQQARAEDSRDLQKDQVREGADLRMEAFTEASETGNVRSSSVQLRSVPESSVTTPRSKLPGVSSTSISPALPRHKKMQGAFVKSGAAMQKGLNVASRRLHDLDFHDGAGHTPPPQIRTDGMES